MEIRERAHASSINSDVSDNQPLKTPIMDTAAVMGSDFHHGLNSENVGHM